MNNTPLNSNAGLDRLASDTTVPAEPVTIGTKAVDVKPVVKIDTTEKVKVDRMLPFDEK
jgi:hypothetical protein